MNQSVQNQRVGRGKYLSLDSLLKVCLIISMANCFFMVVVTILDVLSRHLLKQPVPGVIELNEVLMIGIVFLGLGVAQKQNSHIRAELFVSRLSPERKWYFDLVALIVSLAFWALILMQAIPKAWQSFLVGEYREGLIKFPLWPARWMLAVGVLVMCLQLVADIYNSLTSQEQPVQETVSE